MIASRHITLPGVMVALCTGQAMSLTPPPPPCAYSGDMAEGREVISSSNWPNSFVSYVSIDTAEREYFYVEHCPTGKTLRSKSKPYTVGESGPRSSSEISHTLYNALSSEKPYSLGSLQALMRNQGVASKRFTSKVESCACQTYFPDAVGSKTPYKKDAK